jgi:hypothetical protein
MIRSQALRDSAGHPDAHCMFEIAGVCGDSTDSKTAGCMLCHIRLPGECGGAQKPDDTSAAFGCGPCHRAFDANGCAPLPEHEWMFYALRALARQLRWWFAHGFLTIKGAK